MQVQNVVCKSKIPLMGEKIPNQETFSMYAEITRRNLIKVTDTYGRAMGWSPSTVSLRFYGNATFLREFENRRRSISVERMGRLLAAFANKWPNNLYWPDLEPIHFSKENLKRQWAKAHQ